MRDEIQCTMRAKKFHKIRFAYKVLHSGMYATRVSWLYYKYGYINNGWQACISKDMTAITQYTHTHTYTHTLHNSFAQHFTTKWKIWKKKKKISGKKSKRINLIFRAHTVKIKMQTATKKKTNLLIKKALVVCSAINSAYQQWHFVNLLRFLFRQNDILCVCYHSNDAQEWFHHFFLPKKF